MIRLPWQAVLGCALVLLLSGGLGGYCYADRRAEAHDQDARERIAVRQDRLENARRAAEAARAASEARRDSLDRERARADSLEALARRDQEAAERETVEAGENLEATIEVVKRIAPEIGASLELQLASYTAGWRAQVRSVERRRDAAQDRERIALAKAEEWRRQFVADSIRADEAEGLAAEERDLRIRIERRRESGSIFSLRVPKWAEDALEVAATTAATYVVSEDERAALAAGGTLTVLKVAR